jgi:hypothetical protein
MLHDTYNITTACLCSRNTTLTLPYPSSVRTVSWPLKIMAFHQTRQPRFTPMAKLHYFQRYVNWASCHQRMARVQIADRKKMGCRYGGWLEIGLQLICSSEQATGADVRISDCRLTALSCVLRNALGDVWGTENTEATQNSEIGKDGKICHWH